MALDRAFADRFGNDQWFKDHPVAWAIVNDGLQLISSQKIASHNLQCLLSNMCAYGAVHWTYEPGNTKANTLNSLRGAVKVTDCQTLAEMFSKIAQHLGYEATPRKIVKPGYRIVTKPGVVTFKGKPGDETLEGRWCFGDHWISEYQNACYDPTFKLMGFSFAQVDAVYLGWFAKEEQDAKVFTGTYWKADAVVPGSRNVYMRMQPTVDYTFKRTDRQSGRELAA